jgi:hypothetical protein
MEISGAGTRAKPSSKSVKRLSVEEDVPLSMSPLGQTRPIGPSTFSFEADVVSFTRDDAIRALRMKLAEELREDS